MDAKVDSSRSEQATGHPMDRPLEKRWWRRFGVGRAVVIATVLALLGLGLIAWLGTARRTVTRTSNSVVISTVARGVFRDFVPVNGKVVPLKTVFLDALEGGRVERILAVAGDMVEQGQALVELSNTELELDVLEREARLIESITQLQSYDTQLEQNRIVNQRSLAQIQYDVVRLRRALARQTAISAVVPRETREVLQDELDHNLKIEPLQQESNQRQEELRVEQLPQIKSQVDKLRKDLEITHSKLENLTVRAPISGVLTSLDVDVGANKERGARLGEVTPNAGVKVTASLDEFYLGRLKAGQMAEFSIGGRTWPLTVSRVYPQVKDGSFQIDLVFSGHEPAGLLPGQAVQGKLTLGEDKPALILAAGAFLDTTGGDWAFVLSSDGRSAERRRIRVGRRNAEQVEILSGLEPGERVLTSDYAAYARAERIDIRQ